MIIGHLHAPRNAHSLVVAIAVLLGSTKRLLAPKIALGTKGFMEVQTRNASQRKRIGPFRLVRDVQATDGRCQMSDVRCQVYCSTQYICLHEPVTTKSNSTTKSIVTQ